jgi:hypothetical protein
MLRKRYGKTSVPQSQMNCWAAKPKLITIVRDYDSSLRKNPTRLEVRISCRTVCTLSSWFGPALLTGCSGSLYGQWVSVTLEARVAYDVSICTSICRIVSLVHLTLFLWTVVWQCKRRREYFQTFSQYVQQAPIRIITRLVTTRQVLRPKSSHRELLELQQTAQGHLTRSRARLAEVVRDAREVRTDLGYT